MGRTRAINALVSLTDRSLVDIVAAAIRAADDPNIRSPFGITFDGPHWAGSTDEIAARQKAREAYEQRMNEQRIARAAVRECRYCDDLGYALENPRVRCMHLQPDRNADVIASARSAFNTARKTRQPDPYGPDHDRKELPNAEQHDSTPNPPTPDKSAEALIIAVGKYLDSVGFKALVAGPISLRHYPEARPYNYELVINITGKLRPDATFRNRETRAVGLLGAIIGLAGRRIPVRLGVRWDRHDEVLHRLESSTNRTGSQLRSDSSNGFTGSITTRAVSRLGGRQWLTRQSRSTMRSS